MTDGSIGEDWFQLAELSQRLAALTWVEQELASVLTAWSRVEPHDDVCVAFAEAADHHAWHAEVLAQCLPTSVQLADDARPTPPSPGWADAIRVLRGLEEPARTAVRLGVLVRKVDPWLRREAATLLELGRPIADAALVRWLGFIEIDHEVDGQGIARLFDQVASNTVDLRDHRLVADLDLTIPGSAPGLRG